VKLIHSIASAQLQTRLEGSARAFSATARNPSLRRAQLSFGAAWTAEWAFTVAIGVVAFRDGGTDAVGVVGFVRMAPAAVIGPLGAAFADRYSRERVLLWSCLVRAGALVGAALLLAANDSRLAVYALAVVSTAAFTVFRPAHSALLPALCRTPLELMSANVVRSLLDSTSFLVGPLAAALLLDLGSPQAVFVFATLLSVASGGLLAALSYEAPPRPAPAPLRRIASETLEGFRAVAHYRDAALIVGVAVAQALTRGFSIVFLVVVPLELLGMGAPGVGILTAAVGAGAVGGSLGASIFVSGRRLAAVEGIGVTLWGLPFVLTGAFPHEPVVFALMCVVGVGNALVDVGLFTLVPRVVPDEIMARAFGALESLVALAVAAGALIAPPVIALLGVRGALVSLGLVGPVVVGLSWRALRALDGSIEHRDEEIQVLTQVGMLGLLPMPAIDNLAIRVERRSFGPGQVVFHQGDGGDRFYVIEHGEAEVIGDGRLIGTLGRGEGFGEIALLRDVPRTATVRALTPLDLYMLDRRHFVATVNGYSSSAGEADALVRDRVGAFGPHPGPVA
jgi:MFS family permease